MHVLNLQHTCRSQLSMSFTATARLSGKLLVPSRHLHALYQQKVYSHDHLSQWYTSGNVAWKRCCKSSLVFQRSPPFLDPTSVLISYQHRSCKYLQVLKLAQDLGSLQRQVAQGQAAHLSHQKVRPLQTHIPMACADKHSEVPAQHTE